MNDQSETQVNSIRPDAVASLLAKGEARTRVSGKPDALTHRPKPIRRSFIPKPDGTQRPLGIPTVADRVVQGAVRQVIEPIFEKEFAPHSYGFRPGRGCKDALRQVDQLLKSGHRYAVDADLKSYFDTIPHDRLMAEVAKRVADGRVLKRIESFLSARIMEGLEQWTPAAGAPQGAVLAPPTIVQNAPFGAAVKRA